MPNGICYAAAYTLGDGKLMEIRGCDTINNPGEKFCPDGCKTMTQKYNLTSCVGYCCNTPECNDHTPTNAAGVMVAKFGLCLIVNVILGFIFL